MAMRDSGVLLVSAPGAGGSTAGVIALADGSPPELVDPVPTTGMAVSPDGTKLARLTWPATNPGRSDLMISDHTGLLLYRRIDELEEPHSLLWLDNGLVAVSTMTNSVLWMDDAGRVIDKWSPSGAGAGDCWHLNSLYFDGTTLFVSAFGQFDTHRAWSAPGARAGAGIIVDLSTKRVVVSGLDCPHNPIRLDGNWLVCNSGTQDVRRLSPDGELLQSRSLGGWTRGLLVCESHLLVGVGVPRSAPAGARARVDVLDRSTLNEIRSIPVPGREVFEVIAVSPDLVAGLRVGAATAVFRALGTPDVRMDAPIPPEDCTVDVEILTVERSEVPVDELTITVRLTNTGNRVVSGIGPFPVRLGARHVTVDGEIFDAAERGELDHPLSPGACIEAKLTTVVRPDDAAIRIAAVQENARWLDDLLPSAAVELPVQASLTMATSVDG